MGRLLGVSPLGDYDSPLQLLIYMTAIKPISRVLVRLPKWAPRLDSGRGIQVGGPPVQAASPHLPPDAHPHGSHQARCPCWRCQPSWALHLDSAGGRQDRSPNAQLADTCFTHPMVLLQQMLPAAPCFCASYLKGTDGGGLAEACRQKLQARLWCGHDACPHQSRGWDARRST